MGRSRQTGPPLMTHTFSPREGDVPWSQTKSPEILDRGECGTVLNEPTVILAALGIPAAPPVAVPTVFPPGIPRRAWRVNEHCQGPTMIVTRNLASRGRREGTPEETPAENTADASPQQPTAPGLARPGFTPAPRFSPGFGGILSRPTVPTTGIVGPDPGGFGAPGDVAEPAWGGGVPTTGLTGAPISRPDLPQGVIGTRSGDRPRASAWGR